MSYYGPEEFENYGPSDELSAKIHEMIAEESKGRIKGTFEALESERKSNERLRKENRELSAKVRDFDNVLKQKIKEREIEIRREIFGGFNTGDKVYYPSVKNHKEICGTCGGTHKINATLPDGRGKVVDCPDCGYDGKQITRTEYFPREDCIRTIILEVNDRGGRFFKMYLEKEDRERRETELIFRTMDECQAYCDEKNLPQAIEADRIT